MRSVRPGAIHMVAICLLAACATAPPPMTSNYQATPEEVAAVRQTIEGAGNAVNARDLNTLVAYYTEDAKIDSLAAGGKVSRAQYRDAMTKSFASANPPRVTGGETSVAFADATHATARRDLRVNNSPFRIEYRLEKRDGRWLITQQEYLR
jgi:ketosteroid isomerase-like protein